MKGVADTGFLVAFASERDVHHQWAVEVERQLDLPLLTCEAVLAETAFHLHDVRVVLGLLHDRFIELAFDVGDHLPHLAALAQRYADRHPDLADLCLIRISELHPRYSVITTDREDFQVYRRNKRETIPLVCPPMR